MKPTCLTPIFGLILFAIGRGVVAEEADRNPEEIEPLRTLTAYTVEPGEFGETNRITLVPAVEWEAFGLEFGVGFPVGLTDASEDFGFIGDIEVEF